MSGDTVIILASCRDILETLGVSLLNLSFLIFISFGCCCFFFVFLSNKLADKIDIVLFIGFTMSSVSFLSEEL